MNNITKSVLSALIFATHIYTMDQASSPSYQNILDLNNHTENAASQESQLSSVTRKLQVNADDLMQTALKSTTQNTSRLCALTAAVCFANSIADLHKGIFVGPEHFWQPAGGVLTNLVSGACLAIYATDSYLKTQEQQKLFAQHKEKQSELQEKHDLLFNTVYGTETPLKATSSRLDLIKATRVSISQRLLRTHLEKASLDAEREKALRIGLYALMGICSYNAAKDSFFLTFMNTDPAKTINLCSLIINCLGLTASSTQALSSYLRSGTKKKSIKNLLAELDALQQI